MPAVEAPAAPAEPTDTSIPPARIVTPAPSPVIPQPDQTPAAEAPATPPQIAETPAPAPASAAPPSAPEPAKVEPKPEPQPQTQPTPVTQPAAPAAGAYRVQLAAVRTEEVAASEWNRLKRRYSDVLGSLTPHYQRIDLGASKGVFYRVQGGDVSQAAAQDICARLKAQEQACLVINP